MSGNGTIFIQGDQYILPIKIKQDETVISDAIVNRMRIRLGPVEKRWPDGDLTYNSENSAWYFPLTQDETLRMGRCENIQAELSIGDIIIRSSVCQLAIGGTIIKTKLEDDDENI